MAAAPHVHVRPYWELEFDTDGDPDPARRDRLLREVREQDVHDLVVFAHGWNNEPSTATRLYDRFYAPFPSLAPDARIGYVGVLWPSMMFADEPIPDFHPSAVAPSAVAPPIALDPGTLRALHAAFPDRGDVVDRLAALLDEQPDDDEAFAAFGALLRRLTGAGTDTEYAWDTEDEARDGARPAMFGQDTRAVCLEFADTLERTLTAAAQGPAAESFRLPGGLVKAWHGARELMRQATYYTMKRRAGKVGRAGLGATLGRLAREAPGVRVHLVGHSFGARLVSFALAGLPDDAADVRSVTLLEGAFSHYAFAPRGVLHGRQHRIEGPLVACYSHYDTALAVWYPLASRLAGEDRGLLDQGLLDLGARWGAIGHDGVRGVPDTPRVDLAGALRHGLPATGCVSVDAAQVVRRGGPPSGAHSDICHPELARVVLRAGRITD
ncbi:alpha/beta hydrolase family protein [Streptomyces beihaiensis]|uniref:Serine-threonine protein kinase n=1 Tax=Streptomyces beihaiensis TaxID=2984495 RepID=A0ABT3U3C6_9ACTN|nr:serine-threonine protein kinase [Streptomyces beihaiensis]MCX3063821.1 serine-threonine protein kinase [Streptomyces beihaiensis]